MKKERTYNIEPTAIDTVNTAEIFSCEEFGNLTVIEMDNAPWFVGKEVAEKLEYKNKADALRVHVDKEDKKTLKFKDYRDTRLSNLWSEEDKTNKVVINESGLYSLILGSELESSKKFKRWVTKEILPSIRKHGAYLTPDTLEQTIKDPDFMIGLLTNLKEEQQKRVQAEKQRDRLVHHGRLYTATEIAKELGFTSAKVLNRKLAERKIQYKVNDTWVLNARLSEKGYTSIKQTELENGKIVYDRKWTGRGRDFILREFGADQLEMEM